LFTGETKVYVGFVSIPWKLQVVPSNLYNPWLRDNTHIFPRVSGFRLITVPIILVTGGGVPMTEILFQVVSLRIDNPPL
jgi:hypothetical protein